MDTRTNERLSGLVANTLVASLFFSVALGLAFLALLRHNALACVKAACAVQVVIPAIVGVAALASGAVAGGVVLLVCAALAGLAFYLWRHELALCARLLSVASAALNENAHLVSASVGLQVVAVVTALPLVGFVVAATRVGAPVPSALATSTSPAADGTLMCLDDSKSVVPCCMWQPAGGAVLYIVFASLVLSWCTALIFELRLYSIAHTVARWYYLPLGARLPGKPVTVAMRAAVGPALGSLCLGSAVLTAADVARQAAESARQRGSGLLACLVTSIASCIAELLRLLTRFATVRCAMTGEAFMAAAGNVTELLTRHALSTYGVWRFPPMVLGFTSVALAVGYAGATLLAFNAVGAGIVAHAGAPDSSARADAVQALSVASLGVALGALALVLVVLVFLSSIIVNIVDTLYICFATDLDNAVLARPDVHAIFVAVPAVHVLVQQPDGELGYAPSAATGAAAQPHAAPPRV